VDVGKSARKKHMSWYSRLASRFCGHSKEIEVLDNIIATDDALITALKNQIEALKNQVSTLKEVISLQEEQVSDFREMVSCYEEIISIYEEENPLPPPPKPTLRIVK